MIMMMNRPILYVEEVGNYDDHDDEQASITRWRNSNYYDPDEMTKDVDIDTKETQE